jgi:bifunctional oligoribonuclease and PAP phosphatase NrnA
MIEEITERLHAAKRVLVVSHVRPDGDAVGSALALGLALQNAGKNVQIALADGVPAMFQHLPGSEKIVTAPQGEVDTYITVDCAEFKRVGAGFEAYGTPDINIDHHVTNSQYAKLNLIEGEEAATCSILTKYLPDWGFPITTEIAASLFTGIVTDTLGFRVPATTPATLRQAADLLETGIDLTDLYMRALVYRPYTAARYWGAGLTSLIEANGLVYGTLTLQDRAAAGYSRNDDADLINFISAIEGNKVGMIFVEQPDTVKISWRALAPGIDVSPIAKHFNGGGHSAAAGADIPGTLAEIQPIVLQTTRNMLGL